MRTSSPSFFKRAKFAFKLFFEFFVLHNIERLCHRNSISLGPKFIFDLICIDPSENILRCNVWTRGNQSEVDPVLITNTLLEAFTFALADYVTEYKLLPIIYHNQRYGAFEPPPSPRSMTTVRFAEDLGKYFYFSLILFDLFGSLIKVSHPTEICKHRKLMQQKRFQQRQLYHRDV